MEVSAARVVMFQTVGTRRPFQRHLEGPFCCVPHRGFQPRACYGSNEAAERLLAMLYRDIPLPEEPLSSESEEKTDRNAEICRRYESGENMADLAREYGLSLQRISQIIYQKRS